MKSVTHLGGRIVLAALACVTLALGGCASLSGSAKSVTAVDTRLKQAADYPESAIYKGFFAASNDCPSGVTWPSCRDGLTREAFRNTVAAIYMSAADARYTQFRRTLTREAKGTAFGGDLMVLLMNGISVVSGDEARRALAASSAVVAGSQAAVTKDLFIEKTLPAVLASMDANRSSHKATIRTKLALNANQYTLPDALADIRALEDQAQLDGAVQTLTTNATTDAAEKKAKLDVAFMSPLRGDLTSRISAWLDDLEGLSGANMKAAAVALGAQQSTKTVEGELRQDQAGLLRVWVAQHVTTPQTFNDAVQKTKTLTGKDSYI